MTYACACAGGGRQPLHAVSVVVTPSAPLFTLDEAKLRAGLDWPAGDPRDALMEGFILAAQSQVERDTGLALLTQTRDIFLDWLPPVLELPAYAQPLQAVSAISAIAIDGARTVVDPAAYVVDRAGARVTFTGAVPWPDVTVRPLHPWAIGVIAGYPSADALKAAAPLLYHAAGLLVGHFATRGRDVTTAEATAEMPFGYCEAIASYAPALVP